MSRASGNKRCLGSSDASQDVDAEVTAAVEEFSDAEQSDYTADPTLTSATSGYSASEDGVHRRARAPGHCRGEKVLRITGCWTKAGISSCVLVQDSISGNELLLDCGYFSPETLKAGVVLVTHGHIDHIGSCIAHARARALSKQPAVYFVPTGLVSALQQAKAALKS
jgi:Predicted exonuclease of the beta-lactamase fold involved in RNA processing